MFLLNLFFENAEINRSDKFCFNKDHGKIRKWALLPPGKASQELLRLMAVACGGADFIPHLPYKLEQLFCNPFEPLRIEFILARHAPGDRKPHHLAITGSGIKVKPHGKIEPLKKKDYRYLPKKLKIWKPGIGDGNLHYFLLGYGPKLNPCSDTDNFDFTDPFHRILRFHSLFNPHVHITNPIAYLGRLHYKAILKSRYPALLIIRLLSHLFQKYLAIDTRPWLERKCNFEKEWKRLYPWQQRAVLPVIDTVRHVYDASPKIANPLIKPGVMLLDRPDRFCTPKVFPRWITIMDRLLPNVQFVVSLSQNANLTFPNVIRRRRLQLPATIDRPEPPLTRLASGTILLIDVDSRLPNLALMKLSSYFKMQGKQVILAGRDDRIKGAQEVYASCIFSASQTNDHVRKLREYYGNGLIIGGSGVDIKRRLPKEIEKVPADYRLYPELKDRAIGFLTRGCPFKCSFCIVPVKEGKIRQVSDIDTLLQNRLKKLILLDDNLLSHPKSNSFLKEMLKRDIQVNFNQTLDIRLIDKEKAELLRRIRCSNVKFSRRVYYFSLNDARNLELVRRNYHQLKFTHSDNVEFICMYGYNTTLADDLKRFRFLRSLPGAYVFVQLYRPILGGQQPDLSNFFDDHADEHIDELIRIFFPQNMKSMETYYRWLSKLYAQTFGKLHRGLVDTIFRYNNRHLKGRYIASLASSKNTIILRTRNTGLRF